MHDHAHGDHDHGHCGHHGHDHTHHHDHDHDHAQGHDHEDQALSGKKEFALRMARWRDHNREHQQTLAEWSARVRAGGFEQSAVAMDQAADLLAQSVAALDKALDALD